MGGKSSTTQQTVQIPPEVMARYRSVNQRAEAVGGTPFQQYSTDPSAFVAPINPTQVAGIQNIGSVQNAALPFYGAGAQLTMGGAGSVGPVSGQDIGRYMSPYLGSVVGTTLANLSQEQAMQRQQQIGDAIKGGAFGGDRAGLAAANLARQQGMAYGSTAANLLNQGYGQALGAAQAYQGVEAQNLARQLQAGQQIAGLGSGLTQTGIAAGQALLGAGTAQQQTDQAGLSALYNQFQQERSYPFQVAQFLANIAMGTGALSGSTTTTTQPVPFFSDPRLKENMREIGQTHDGLPLYAFNYRGRPGETQIGLNADEVEQVKPEAVGLAGGYKTVDYDAATRPRGGLDPMSSMGGAVIDLEPGEYRENFAAGGAPDFSASLAQLYAMFGTPHGAQPGGGLAGPYGGRQSYVPPASLPIGQLKTAGPAPKLPDSVASQAISTGSQLGLTPRGLYDMGEKGLGAIRGSMQTGPSRAAPPPPVSPAAPPAAALPQVEYDEGGRMRRRAYGGLAGYAAGGDVDDPMESYGPRQGGLDIPTEQPDIKPLEPAKPPPPPNSIFGDILGAAKTAASIYAMSDERMKRGMEPVGELYNGLPVYRYSIGDGPTQIGLSAQEASGLHPGAAIADRNGILHLDYDRATRAYGGGLMPRMGYAEGGTPRDRRAQFAEEMMPHALRISEETGLDPRLVVAQSALETNWGRSAPGQNYFGIKSHGRPGGQSLETTEVVSGSPVRSRESFRSYGDMGASADDYAQFLKSNPRYRGVLEARDLDSQIAAMARSGYATDPQYGSKLNQIASSLNFQDGVLSYAGQPQRGEASSAIDRQAGTSAGLGAARVQARGEAAPAEERGLIASLLPTKFGTRTVATPKGEQFGSLGEFLTSRQFIQPLFEGVGAMASSPNLSGWGAALQGLGAASRAYTGLEKEMAGTGLTTEQATQTRMEGERTRQQVTVGSFFTDSEGRAFVSYFRPDGTRDVMPFIEWYKLRPDQRPNLDPASQRQADEYARTKGISSPTGTPSLPRPQQVSLEKQASPQVSKEDDEDYVRLPAGAAERAAKRANDLYSAGTTAIAAQPGLKIFKEQAETAKQMQDVRPQLDALATALASLPRGGNVLTSGQVQSVAQPVVAVLNNLATMAGAPEIVSTTDIANVEDIRKLATTMSAQTAREGNQASISALRELANAIPTNVNSPEGQEKLIVELLQINQDQIDKQRFFQKYIRAAEGENTELAKATPALGAEAQDLYVKEYRTKRALEKESLRKMFREGPPGAVDESGRPQSWMTYLMKNAGSLTPDQRKSVEKLFGKGILRYYGVGS